MTYIALKPLPLGGRRYKIGDVIPESAVNPERVYSLSKSGYIAEQGIRGRLEHIETEVNRIPVLLRESNTGLFVKPDEVSACFDILQMNVSDGVEAINAIQSENVLLMVHAVDSRKGIRVAAEARMETMNSLFGNTMKSTAENEGDEENDV